MNRTTFLLPMVALATILSACGSSVGPLGSLPASGSPEPSVGQGSPDVTAPPSTSPGTEPSTEPTEPGFSDAPGTSSPSAAPGATSVVRAYFFLDGPSRAAGLVPVLREVPQTKAVATAAMTSLLAGPTDAERGTWHISSTVPAGSRLLGISIDQGVATVDLSREFESGGGSASALGRLAQVVYTLTQFPTVTSVRFQIEGRAVDVFGSEGIVLERPSVRADFEDQLPSIFVDRPAFRAAFGNPGRVTGTANVFEAQFRLAVLDAAGRTLVDDPVMATCGSGCRGTFDLIVGYAVDKAQWGTLRVWDPSEVDGSPEAVREYPVWLTPGG